MSLELLARSARTPDGLTLPVDLLGHGPPVLFINGLTQTRLHWRTQLRRFAQAGYQAAAYDGRGQGRVPCPGVPTRAQHAADLQAVQDALGWPRCHLVGFSHGARVAVALALAHPERVERLVLVGASGGLNARARLVVEGWRETLAGLGPEALARHSLPWILGDRYLEEHAGDVAMMVRTAVHRAPAAGTAALLEGLLADPGDPAELARLAVPTLVLGGAQDRFAPPELARDLAARIPGAALALVADSGHTVSIEAPEAFLAQVDAFLRGLDHGGPGR